MTAIIDQIADDIGRLRRRGDNWILDRLAGSLDTLDALLNPTAAELARNGHTIDQALQHVDRHRSQLLHRMRPHA